MAPAGLLSLAVLALRPALATLFLIDLITAWDEFFSPLIFSRSPVTTALTLGLIAIVPVFFLAMVFQKQIVEGLMARVLKG